MFLYCRILPGTMKLDQIKTSTSFAWNGQEVVANAGQGAIYIVAHICLPEEVSWFIQIFYLLSITCS